MILLIASACTDLAGNVEIVQTLPPPPTRAPQTLEAFDTVVSLDMGAQIFAENCTSCHGIAGEGNGELVLSGQVGAISDFTDPQTIADQSLQSWFETITTGRLENLMPPWANALSAQERWAVALYTYTMSYDDAMIADGQTAYSTSCADCHAADGTGTENGSSLIGLTSLTEAQLAEVLQNHNIELELDTSENDLVSTLQYMRLLSAETQQHPDPSTVAAAPEIVTTEEVADEAVADNATVDATAMPIPQSTGILRGQIIMGTDDGGSVEGLEAIIRIYDSQLREQIAEYTVGGDGTYQFDEVVIRPDYAYRVTAEYKDVTYTSQIVVGNPDETEIELDVTVYDSGATADDIEITSRATQVNIGSQGLYIIEVIELVNNSNRSFIRDDIDGLSEPASVGFAIPAGAQLQLEHTDPNRILLSEDGLMVYDVAPVLPNTEHYVQFSYNLPIAAASDLAQPVDYAINGVVGFFVEASHLNFVSDAFSPVETRMFNNREYEIYRLIESPAVGDNIEYAIELDDSPLTDDTTSVEAVPRSVIALVLLLIGFGFVGLAAFLVWRNRQPSAPDDPTPPVDSPVDDANTETLLRQIAALDDQFKAGDIDEDDYHQQRDALKKQLRELMKSQG